MSDYRNSAFIDFIAFNEKLEQCDHLQEPYYQLGFICSVQALPEQVGLEQWLSYLCLDGADISFDNELQATEYAKKVLMLVSEIQHLYQHAMPLNDLNCNQWLTEQKILSNEATQFSAGFLAAIELFNTQWAAIDEQSNTQNLLQTTILLLSKLAASENIEQQLLDLFEQLPEPVEILQILPQLLSNLAYSAAQNTQSDQ
tara:strand:+ start:21936 stop:22535 length:600 start_codon:yes stop_codon:yes gene_type:complete